MYRIIISIITILKACLLSIYNNLKLEAIIQQIQENWNKSKHEKYRRK